MSETIDPQRGQPGDAAHLGELAELYALGALEPPERAGVEAYAATCVACARALMRAAKTVAALDSAFVPTAEPPGRLAARIAVSAQAVVSLGPRRVARRTTHTARGFAAVAAGLTFAAGLGGGAFFERSAQSRQTAQASAILATIATSHFNHVTLTKRDAMGPVSKVLYARDGTWIYVIVDSATCGCHVVLHSANDRRDIGAPDVRGNTATLFAKTPARPSELELINASGNVLEDATLVYLQK